VYNNLRLVEQQPADRSADLLLFLLLLLLLLGGGISQAGLYPPCTIASRK